MLLTASNQVGSDEALGWIFFCGWNILQAHDLKSEIENLNAAAPLPKAVKKKKNL